MRVPSMAKRKRERECVCVCVCVCVCACVCACVCVGYESTVCKLEEGAYPSLALT